MSYIEFKDITKIYKMGEVEINALNKASFEIEKGELVCILGPSGAGKTTTIKLILGLQNFSKGNIEIIKKSFYN